MKYETRWWFEAFFSPRKFWGRCLQPFWLVHIFFFFKKGGSTSTWFWLIPSWKLSCHHLTLTYPHWNMKSFTKCGRFRLWLMDFWKVGVRWWKVVNGDQCFFVVMLMHLPKFLPFSWTTQFCWASKDGGKFHERYLAFRGSEPFFQAPKQIDLKWDEDWGISWWKPMPFAATIVVLGEGLQKLQRWASTSYKWGYNIYNIAL